jgi:serine/threonine-protein kinase
MAPMTMPAQPTASAAVAAPGAGAPRADTRVVAGDVRRSLGVLGVCLAAAVAALWLDRAVERSLKELRAQSLPALLDAKTLALAGFLDQRRDDAQRWARESSLAQATTELARIAALDPARLAEDCRSDAQVAWRRQAVPRLASRELVAINVVLRDGRIAASTLPDQCGRIAQPRVAGPQLEAVLRGSTQVVMPFARNGALVAARPRVDDRPVAWIETPARDGAGNVVAVLGFAMTIENDLRGILGAARPGETGEVYAIDESGTLLSDSRHEARLREAGVLPADASVRSAFRVQVRDPGGPLTPETARTLGERPWTASAAAVLDVARGGASGEPARGVIVEPYRNYRGDEVIGAWRWMPGERTGVIAEIGADEAYAPLRYVRTSVAVVLALLVATAGWAAWSTLSLARLRRNVGSGRKLGAYRLERELAEGGMATVHLAHHALLKRPTAIKILKRHLATDEVSARFEREVRLASELQHPNTIEIYDYGHTPDGLNYFAMEYVEGVTLEQLVARDGPVPLPRTRFIVRQACAALREVHARGMVHRDVKPDNIMITERGGEFDFVKVIDFGIGKRVGNEGVDDPGQRLLTRQIRLLGTPAYMAPERIGHPSAVDARADVYGVGAILFFLLAGRPVFVSADEAACLRAVLAEPPPSLHALVPGLPRPLVDLVERCLAKSPEGRPGSVQAIIDALDALEVAPWTDADARRWWTGYRASLAG